MSTLLDSEDALEHLRLEALRLIDYAPLTGAMTWRISRGRMAKAGASVGGKNSQGYVILTICGVKMKAHRLAMLMYTGRLPKLEVDHINGVRDDNRIANLRVVQKSINQHNRRFPRTDSKQLAQGVCKMGNNGRYWARITINKREIYIGSFDSAEAAQAAYWNAKNAYIDASDA